MTHRSSFAASLAIACLLAGAVFAQDQTDVEKLFGQPGVEGYRILFDRYGAAVKHVNLIDHAAELENADGSRDDYLLTDVYWVNPALPSQYHSWLRVREWGGSVFADVDPSVALWDVLENDAPNRIVFALDLGGGIQIRKSFTFESGRRDLLFELSLHASDEHPRAGEEMGWAMTGLAVRSPKIEYTLGQNPAKAVGEVIDAAGETELHSITPAAKPEQLAQPLVQADATWDIRFIGSTNRFFGAFLFPVEGSVDARLVSASVSRYPSAEQDDTPPQSVPVCEFGMRFTVPHKGETSKLACRYYLGPKSNRIFEQHPDYVRFSEIVSNDLNPGCFCTPPGTRAIGTFLLWLLEAIQSFVGNWGLAIVILTICVRGALVPLNFRMQKSMRAYGAKTAKLKPKLEALQKQHANDKQAYQRAMVEFQKEHKLFPPLGGCLPMFVTIPVFIGLFTALRTSYDLRQQPFLFWIDDLSKPDQLIALGWGHFMPYFNLLPILMVGLWWWLQASTPLPSDPQQRQMMKIMRFMPLMFGVMLYNYASGLMVYMITSSLFALVEQRVVRKILGPVSGDAAAFSAPTI
ncbi:MAG: membrane protein insertase YidC [Planctomycetes bacterium]|nr:membrane protein insertase YidC [Planctomycetota bacterium]